MVTMIWQIGCNAVESGNDFAEALDRFNSMFPDEPLSEDDVVEHCIDPHGRRHHVGQVVYRDFDTQADADDYYVMEG